jgi:hypothetical protein
MKTYSPTEFKLLKMIPKDGKRTTTEKLMHRFYYGRVTPRHGRVYIANSMRSLIDQVIANKETFRIKRTPKGGQRKIEYWYVKN